jgi:glycosyltransferase involved in cell wall biosynthesis
MPRVSVRTTLGFDSFTLLSVGQLVKHKGHDRAIGALAELPDVRLVIVGGGPERERLVRLARHLQVEDRVRFAGILSQGELRAYYSAADALVLASDREGWANVLLEAMACGTPALASDVGGTSEVVTCHAAGRLLPSNCAAGVAQAVRALRERLPSRDATREYAERFDWNDTTRAKLALLKNAVHSQASTDASYVHAQ